MSRDDMPTFTASAYSTHTVPLAASGNLMGALAAETTDAATRRWLAEGRQNQVLNQALPASAFGGLQHKAGEDMAANKSKLRIVRVFLVDPDERVPMDKRVLHRTDEITTDATDQELFFGIPVQDLLKQHNELRASVKWKDEGSKAEAEPLKEIRIRDLIMSVTTIAEFQGR